MRIHSFRSAALDAAVGFLQTARDPENTTSHIFRMLRHIDSSELSQKAFISLASDSDHHLNVKERYDPVWPSKEERRRLPANSLGACFQRRLDSERLKELPPSCSNSDYDWEYLANRLLRTHDFHHLVLGLPDTLAGEAVASTYYACRYRSPGALAVMTTWLTHGLIEENENNLIWMCVSFGIVLAEKLPISLLAVRWEEGWSRPLDEWRDQLGIPELLEISPLSEHASAWLH